MKASFVIKIMLLLSLCCIRISILMLYKDNNLILFEKQNRLTINDFVQLVKLHNKILKTH